VVLVLVLLVLCGPARGGAWLRDPGEGFLSFGTTIRPDRIVPDHEAKLYLEYGVAKRLTLGVDINETPGVTGHAILFARLPVGRGEGALKQAMEMGIGGHHWQEDWWGFYKLGYSLGRGVENRRGNAWWALDANYDRRLGNDQPLWKLDFTWGQSSGMKIRPLMKVETGYIPSQGVGGSLVPSLMIPGFGDEIWVAGLEFRHFGGQNSVGLRLDIWKDFGKGAGEDTPNLDGPEIPLRQTAAVTPEAERR
tara:strand:- start:445 stop:1194 length:750 start_codon:yes stop_codon:yes gene_type:complete